MTLFTELSPVPVIGTIVGGRSNTTNLLIDYETGGIGLNDPSAGLEYQIWTGEVLNLREIYISAPNTPRTLIYANGYEITELSISFDQNMHPFAAFVDRSFCRLFYYDSVNGANAVMSLPAGSRNPRLTMDDKRPEASGINDVLLFYMRDTTLLYRIQRERFQIEHVVATNISGDLLRVGMSDKSRIQFDFGTRMSQDDLMQELAKGSPISDSAQVTPDSAATPSDSDIWELEKKS